MKVKTYDGRDLEGLWEVSYKIDGIQCRRTEDGWVSKSGKQTLYGLDRFNDWTVPGEMYEYFDTDWNTSSAIRRKDHVCQVQNMYMIYPVTDCRLYITTEYNINQQKVYGYLNNAVFSGYEGIMLRQGDIVYRVKPTKTYDVLVTDIYEGKGKHEGRMGGVVTDRGKVGGGWSDVERHRFWQNKEAIIGQIIEVKCMELTKNGKFRHGNKVRIRWDKE